MQVVDFVKACRPDWHKAAIRKSCRDNSGITVPYAAAQRVFAEKIGKETTKLAFLEAGVKLIPDFKPDITSWRDRVGVGKISLAEDHPAIAHFEEYERMTGRGGPISVSKTLTQRDVLQHDDIQRCIDIRKDTLRILQQTLEDIAYIQDYFHAFRCDFDGSNLQPELELPTDDLNMFVGFVKAVNEGRNEDPHRTHYEDRSDRQIASEKDRKDVRFQIISKAYILRRIERSMRPGPTANAG